VTVGESGEPLPAATIVIVGTRIGSITGPDGRFTVAGVPPGQQVVRAQRIGFGPDSQTVTVVADQTVTVDFALRPVAVQLEEVVSIGYGTQERRDVTGAISSVTAEELQAAPVPSVDQALIGRAPGVQVTSASGQPGAAAMVRVRGGNSISASNEPLYVIDGVPIVSSPEGSSAGQLQSQGVSGLNPLAALNPNDIESIEILKDASSAAIYGARAANGVVLITTRRGRAGESSLSISAYYGTQEVRNQLDLLNARQFAQLANQARINAGEAPLYTDAEIAAFGRGTDWQDAIFRSAPMRNVDVAVTGGDERTRYYISGNLNKTDGVVIGTQMDRGSLRLNLDREIGSRFRIGNSLTFSRSEGQILPNGGNGQEQSSVILNAILAPPTLPIRTGSGEFFIDVNPANGRFFSNPVATALEITNEERQNRLVGNVFGEYDITEGLRFRSTFGVDYLNSLQSYFSPSTTFPGRNVGGTGRRATVETTSWLNENTLNWRHALGDLHDIDLLGGITLQRTSSDNVGGQAQGFLTDRLRENNLGSATTFTSVFTGAPEASLLSYFARANWGIADRYLFTVTGRVDGSSKFGSGNRYGFFPSAAFAWRASEEGFISRLGVFDDLKLRVGYGRTGNQDIGNFESLARLGSTVYIIGGTRAIGYAPVSIANPDLKWETTDQVDVGIDATFLNSRISITADYYNKNTKDLLLFVPIPATSGFGTSLQNIGSVRNRGFELSLSTVNLTGALGWETELNLAWNRNKVLDLGPRDEIIGLGGVGAGAVQDPTILRVGEPTSAFHGWVFDRVENGTVVYRDLNGDGEVTAEDRTIIGSAQPDYTGGLNNRFTWRDFDLSVFLQWSVGNDIYNINRALLTNAAGNANQLADVLDGGADGIPTPKAGNTFDATESSLFVEDGTYLRGKNIRLGWTVPQSLLARAAFANLSTLQIYVSAQNFFTVTDYSGFDPEISEYATRNILQGFDFGTYPQPRQFTIGLTAGF
jgi:TonB-linked SusC/RagA family outer membrane protein